MTRSAALFALCLVSEFAFFALSLSVHWGEGAANFVPGALFGLFALVRDVASTSTLIDAVRRALRSEPYHDKSPSLPEVR